MTVEVQPLSPNLNNYDSPLLRDAVTVYGWSGSTPGSERWIQAERVGALAAGCGLTVITGGYCGSMEATSKGAREHQSGRQGQQVKGILVPGQFPDRQLVGNKYLTESVDAHNMLQRLDILSSESKYFIVLPGTLGTLTELCIIWTLAVLHPKGHDKPLVLAFRDPWEKCVRDLCQTLAIPAHHFADVHFIDTPEQAFELIQADRARCASSNC